MNEKREQLVKQLEAVAYLATALAGVSADLAKVYGDPRTKLDGIEDMIGNRTAHQMEVLGDILNAMDTLSRPGRRMADASF